MSHLGKLVLPECWYHIAVQLFILFSNILYVHTNKKTNQSVIHFAIFTNIFKAISYIKGYTQTICDHNDT